MAQSLQELQQGVSGLTAEAETESVPVVELPGYSKLSPRQMEVAELLAYVYQLDRAAAAGVG